MHVVPAVVLDHDALVGGGDAAVRKKCYAEFPRVVRPRTHAVT